MYSLLRQCFPSQHFQFNRKNSFHSMHHLEGHYPCRGLHSILVCPQDRRHVYHPLKAYACCKLLQSHHNWLMTDFTESISFVIIWWNLDELCITLPPQLLDDILGFGAPIRDHNINTPISTDDVFIDEFGNSCSCWRRQHPHFNPTSCTLPSNHHII